MPSEAGPESLTGLHTFPRLLLNHARSRPDAPAMREKYLGIWQTLSWAEVAVRVVTTWPSSATTGRTST